MFTDKIEDIENKLAGWHKIMHERCISSELAEAKKINFQECIGWNMIPYQQSRGIYAFSATLKPGYH